MSASCRDRGRRARAVLVSAALTASIAAPAAAAAAAEPEPFDSIRYGAFLDQVATHRGALGARYAAARGVRARAAIRDEARRYIVGTVVSRIFPAWMGMPSGGGPQATASLPHQPGMYI